MAIRRGVCTECGERFAVTSIAPVLFCSANCRRRDLYTCVTHWCDAHQMRGVQLIAPATSRTG